MSLQADVESQGLSTTDSHERETDSSMFEALESVAQSPDGQQLVDQGLPWEELEDSFTGQWKAVRKVHGAADLLEQLVERWEEQPAACRSIAIAYVAQELGYKRRRFRSNEPLQREPLWDLLRDRKFDSLHESSAPLLLQIARSTPDYHPTMIPEAALSAIALWLHLPPDDPRRQHAAELLANRSLPDDPHWLHELVGDLQIAFGRKGKQRADDRLEELLRLQLQAGAWSAVALCVGMRFVRQFDRWSGKASPDPSLLRACDLAAGLDPRSEERWLQLMADAAIGGQLKWTWLERPIDACLRLSISDAERLGRLRAYNDRRPFDADHARLEELYEAWLSRCKRFKNDRKRPGAGEPLDEASGHLVEEARACSEGGNPLRAQRILELLLLRRYSGRRAHISATSLQDILPQARFEGPLYEPERYLLTLYLRNYNLDASVARFVRRGLEQVDLQRAGLARAEVDLYLMVSDHQRAYRQLTCKFDGVALVHGDKDAAARLRYFLEKRIKPSAEEGRGFWRSLYTPAEWLGSSISNLSLLAAAADKGLQVFEARALSTDLRQQVLEDLRAVDVQVDDFDHIAQLSCEQIEAVLAQQRKRRVLWGALAGALSAGLAPVSSAAISLVDIPVLLALAADICARFCWYYGFDPREHEELPMEILAVALGGARPEAIEPMLLRQSLREFVVNKSLVLGTLSRVGARQLAARAAGQIAEATMGQKLAQQMQSLLRRAVRDNLQKRAVQQVPSRAVPLFGALLGAALNGTLVFDICEAAQAVLTDRFLERKYPDWIRRLES